jgi:hypothetical protein
VDGDATTPDNRTVMVFSCDGLNWIRVNKSIYLRGYIVYNFTIKTNADCTNYDIALNYP